MSESEPKRPKSNDFIANIKADDAVEASRQRAIAPAQRQRRANTADQPLRSNLKP
jgi:hypothetical protein